MKQRTIKGQARTTIKTAANWVTVTAYNDSGAEWVVQVNGRTDRFDMRKWTMRDAMTFAAELYGNH